MGEKTRALTDEGEDGEHEREDGRVGERGVEGGVEDGDGGDDGGEDQLRAEDAVDLADEAPAEGVLPARDPRVERLPVPRLQVDRRRLHLLLHLRRPAVARRCQRLHLRRRRHLSRRRSGVGNWGFRLGRGLFDGRRIGDTI